MSVRLPLPYENVNTILEYLYFFSFHCTSECESANVWNVPKLPPEAEFAEHGIDNVVIRSTAHE